MGKQVRLLAEEANRLGLLCTACIGIAWDLRINASVSRLGCNFCHWNHRYPLAMDRYAGSSGDIELVSRPMRRGRVYRYHTDADQSMALACIRSFH